MLYKEININKNKNILVFFAGWGFDEHPFAFLKAKNFDELIVYNYTDLKLPQEFFELLSNYEKVYVIAWSIGVWAFNEVVSSFADFNYKALAINGTLLPFHADFGINPRIMEATFLAWGDETRSKFYERIFIDKALLDKFEGPKREAKDQKEELGALIKMLALKRRAEIKSRTYCEAWVSQKDKIIPAKNQIAFWNANAIPTKIFEDGHFLFFGFKDFDEIINAYNR